MKLRTLALAVLATLYGGSVANMAAAANVDLATTPMISGLSKVVPPNVHFILDDSGSMLDDFMPDSVDGTQSRPCFRNFGYNTIYYNPATTYVLPLNANGTSFPASSYTGAKVDGFSAASTTTDLSANQTVVVRLTNNPFATVSGSKIVTVTHANHGLTAGKSVKFTNASNTLNNVALNNQTYTVTSVVNANSYRITSATNANRTGSGGGTSPPRANFDLPIGTYWEYVANPSSPPSTCQADTAYAFRTPSTAQKVNFANWYTYYRVRLNMMKSASGRAFSTIDDKFRVGLDRINNRTSNSVLVNIKKFDSTQRNTWYTSLYGVSANGYTPLRGALSKAGRLFAGNVVTGNNDPVQYSCQQNFAILTTDGYWNLQNEVTGTATTNYGPRAVDNVTAIGDLDGVAGVKPPYFDKFGAVGTLADVAYYYWKTDLRRDSSDPLGALNPTGGLLENNVTRLDVTANNVPSAGGDNQPQQHMTTFGLGLGVSGTLSFSDDYLSGGNATYESILQGNVNWPDPLVTNTATELPERIDDLWHAAVNGRGRYLSASNPDAVVVSLRKALAAISQVNASSAAAATSNLVPVQGDKSAFVARYTTIAWYGDLLSKDIDLTNGSLTSTSNWSARDRLNLMVGPSSDTRNIYTFSASGTNKLKSFDAANLTAEKTAGYFNTGLLSQYGAWDSTQKTAATADALIAFLRGQDGLENQTGNSMQLFRDREHALGDIVNAAPVYVKKPPFKYGDAGYAAFISANVNRVGTVYVGANDGMLHAFDSETGSERWAYVPTAVIPNMVKLADATYGANHQFYVDGPITVGDAYDGTNWRTVLVGGLGSGGRAYFALDVTDPANPKALWEFGTSQDADLGYTYGNPILTKRMSDGRWVVLFASGYNNTLGDGKGRLYVVDAFTGAKLQEIITDNSINDPNVSGIAKTANWVLSTLVDNSTQYVYGGDLGGSLWRFNLTAGSSQLLGRTSSTAGNQPITVRPELSRIKDASGTYHRVVYFGTGRYLGFGDISPTAPSTAVAQGIYAVKDTAADLGVFTSVGANLVAQTLDSSVNPRTIPNPVGVDWAAKNGWYVTLPVGERVNIDPRLQLGVLVVGANVPKDDYCLVGGSSWKYQLDFRTGGALATATNKSVGAPIGNSLVVGLTLMQLEGPKLVELWTLADTTNPTGETNPPPPAGNAARRVGWREIF